MKDRTIIILVNLLNKTVVNASKSLGLPLFEKPNISIGYIVQLPQGIPFFPPSCLQNSNTYIVEGRLIIHAGVLSFCLSHGDGRRGWDEYGMGIVRRIPEREREGGEAGRDKKRGGGRDLEITKAEVLNAKTRARKHFCHPRHNEFAPLTEFSMSIYKVMETHAK